jgi:hypothetical protein
VLAAAACVRHPAAASCRPLFFIYYLFAIHIYYLVLSAAATYVRHPAGHASIVYLFIYLLFIDCLQQQHA